MKVILLNLIVSSPYGNISKFVDNCFKDKVSLVDHLATTTFLVLPFLALETGCFSEHFYISRAFIKFPYVISKSSISAE